MTKDKIKLFIVDHDSIFRLGLHTAIALNTDFEVVGEGNLSNDTFRQLTQGLVLNVLLIGISSQTSALEISSLEFCQQLRQLYPQLPIFLLTSNFSLKKLTKIKSWGVRGYCDRTSSIETIIEGLYSVAYGDLYWQIDNVRPQVWQTVLSRISKPGRLQIEENLQDIEEQLNNLDLSDWERAFLVGRKRELLAARWISNRLVSEEIILQEKILDSVKKSPPGKLTTTPPTTLTPVPVFEDSANKVIFERVVLDIQLGLINQTNIPLEIDILQPQVQKDLYYLILKHLSETVSKIPNSNILAKNYTDYLKDLWQWSISNFFTQYYGQLTEEEQQQLVILAQQEFTSVNQNIFNYLHDIPELFEYLLGKPGLTVDNITYQSDAPEAIARIEFLLHNLITHLANAVMQVILNNFSDLEIFKYKLYKSEYKSDRQLARFRNQLSWKYRQELYFANPQNIFESRHRLFVLIGGKIRTLFIYAPRKEELEQLTGIPWVTTIVIEIRDAIAPLVRKFIALAGSSVVFVLTQVIGKGLGLIAKGIIQGIGSTMKDVPYNKKNQK